MYKASAGYVKHMFSALKLYALKLSSLFPFDHITASSFPLSLSSSLLPHPFLIIPLVLLFPLIPYFLSIYTFVLFWIRGIHGSDQNLFLALCLGMNPAGSQVHLV